MIETDQDNAVTAITVKDALEWVRAEIAWRKTALSRGMANSPERRALECRLLGVLLNLCRRELDSPARLTATEIVGRLREHKRNGEGKYRPVLSRGEAVALVQRALEDAQQDSVGVPERDPLPAEIGDAEPQPGMLPAWITEPRT